MKLTLWSRICVLLLSITLMSCARTAELNEDETDLFAQSASEMLGDSALANPEVQQELREVTVEIQNAIFAALVPEYSTASFSDKAVSVLGCTPKFVIVGLGVGIEFTASSNCKLNGTVALKLFPLTTVVDLDVVGMKYVEKIQLDANVVLAKGSTITVDLTFLNGHFSIRAIPLLPLDDIRANGIVKLSLGSSVVINSRINAFDGGSGLGVALIAQIDKAAGVRNIQSCLMSGGQALVPEAGSLKACFRLGGG